MSEINIKKVCWNGEVLSFQVIKGNLNDLHFYLVQDECIKVKINVTIDENDVHIPVQELMTHEAGDWKIMAKNHNKDQEFKLEFHGPSVPKKMIFLKPIHYASQEKAIVPYTTKKRGLCIKVSTPILLEEALFLSYKKSITITSIIDKKDFVLLVLSQESLDFMNEAHHYEIVYSENMVSLKKDAIIYSKKEKGFMLNKQVKQSGAYFFHIQFINNHVIEKYEPYINFSSFDQELNSERDIYKYSITDRFVLQIREQSTRDHLEIIKGNLSLTDFYMDNRDQTITLKCQDTEMLEHSLLYLKHRGTSKRINLDFKVVYNQNHPLIKVGTHQFDEEEIQNTRWDLYAERKTDKYIELLRVGLYNAGSIDQTDKYIGYHQITQNQSVIPYITKANEVSFQFATKNHYYKNKHPLNISVKKLSMKQSHLIIKLDVRNEKNFDLKISGLDLVLRSDHEKKFRIESQDVKAKGDLLRSTFSIDLLNYPFEQFYWDLHVIVEVDGKEISLRLANDNLLINKKLKHFMFKHSVQDKFGYVIYPYVTMNGGVSLTYRLRGDHEDRPDKWKEYLAFFTYHVWFKFFNRKKIWLVHEKYSETAQDNSFYFFKYAYENHNDKQVYYVIKKGTADESNVKAYMDRVVYFMSFKHLLLLIASKLIVSSEAKGHGYAWRVSQGVIKEYLNEKKYIFLQHGVLGLKKVDSTFNYNTANTAELFVVSSDYEKEIVKHYFGYKEKHMMVTGLPRWDVLRDRSHESNEKEIFFMPTWRNWLEEVTEDEFIKSDYYKSYNELLNSRKLYDLLKMNNVKLNFYVHPKFMPYVKSFVTEHKNINILAFGDAKVNDLLMRASLLITDYSSVAWEMYYQKKPVVFFQFDRDKYNYYQGAYMDLEKDLFGDACYDVSNLVSVLSHYMKSGFKEKAEFATMRSDYFKHIDNHNSERIFQEILIKEKEIYQRRSLFERIKKNDLIKTAWRRYKKIPTVNKVGKYIISKAK
ncbi:CDP-glycerol glycerophosphotransferase family protein [Shouchella sp. 1P09AA]|uniref:CDP-glycerol glycerophosphotransferase family protein n=1 Tax=unclassified Shouchella TaxID=2893065 RepID=UPI00399F75A0